MGIPKFYRWLSERYPLINQPGGATVVPIIDNLYLDMNGIIHNCTHGNNPDVKPTEDEMIVKIFTYLDKLFHIVKPQKLLFMAIDGSAPRAKMNQQRARRFKSAREAQEAMEAAVRRGEPPPDPDSRFDSNCITPGTPFMARLGAHIRFFIRKKMAEDTAWQKPTIIFSGHDVPGEGEHKIMEYIRWQKRRPDYAPNTRHCLYGLDADLIMLSLVTHEPHFCLLREVVSFTGGGHGQPAREVLDNPCQEHFVLLQIGLLRDYFDAEFRTALAGRLPFAYDLERVVDDFVLFCMLVGNDFLPPLPTVDINEGSLDAMFALYKQLLPSLGGYLTHAGELNRGRLETFMRHLAEAEADVLQARAEDAEAFEAKRSRGRGEGGQPAWASSRVTAKRSAEEAARLQDEIDEDDAFALDMAKLALQAEGHELELLAAVEGEGEAEDKEGAPAMAAISSEPTMMSQEARNLFLNGDKDSGLAAWKSRYYREKLHAAGEAGRRAVVEAYIQGLHWVLEYYYRGVASWNWYYPFHYAPMASDLSNLTVIPVSFSLGKPFLPYEQLLAVQPSSSHRLLPAPYQQLMCSPSSPIADFYPTDFRVDLEGKRADWEGVVLIPFIDEERLLAAARSVPPAALSEEERQRNTLGDILVFSHAPGIAGETEFCTSTLPAHFASVAAANSRAVSQAAPPPLPTGERGFVPQFVAGTKTGSSGPPGFPSLATIKSTAELRKIGVNVFGIASRKESLILQIKGLAAQLSGQRLGAEQVAGALLGQRCWVKWPHLQEAVVEAVSDAGVKVSRSGGAARHGSSEAGEWQQERQRLQQEYLHKQGVDCGEVTLLVHVRPCEGLVRQVDGTIEKRFAKKEVAYPLELVVRRNPAPDPRFQPETASASLAAYEFKPGARALFLGRSYYGCMATILPDAGAGLTKKGQQLVAGGGQAERRTNFRIQLEPGPANSATIAQSAKRVLGNINVQYSPSGQVARRLGVSHRTLGRMTGNVRLQAGEERRDRVDVGLCVKNGGKGLYVPDFARPFIEAGNAKGWAYSEALVRILDEYRRRFPWLWAAIEQDASPGEFQLDDVLPQQPREQQLEQVAALRKWLKGLPLSRRPLVKLSAKVAPEPAVKMLQAALPPRAREQAPVELENVAPTLLLPPTEKGGMAAALAGGVFDIGDRVAAITGSGSPAFGCRGTVVGTYDDAVEVVFDSEVAGGSDLYGRCNGTCGMLLPASDLLNLSKPAAVKAEGQHAPRVVRAQRAQQQQQQPAAAAAAGGASNGAARPAVIAVARRPNPAAALQAAAAGLVGTLQPGAPAPAAANGAGSSGGATASSKQQPKIPDQPNAKGFGMGRGSVPALPPGLALAAAAKKGQGSAPGAPPARPPPAGAAAAAPAPADAAGQRLLAQLRRSVSTPVQPPPAPAAPPPPGAALLQQLQRGVAGVAQPALPVQHPQQPPSSPAQQQQQQQVPASPLRSAGSGQALLAQLQSPVKPALLAPPPSPGLLMSPPRAGPVPPAPIVAPAHAAPPSPAAPPPGLALGSALLQQLQRPAGAPPAPLAAPAPGMQLLSQLQQGAQALPAPVAVPPAGGASLLQRLQTAPARTPAPAAAAPAAGQAQQSNGQGGYSALWQQLQQQHAPPHSPVAPALPPMPAMLLASAPAPPLPAVAPSPPAAPSAAPPHQAPGAAPMPAPAAPPAAGQAPPALPPNPSDLWNLLSNASKK
ncbi:hypothetical protein ABPG75_009634 [Micractinium tetrahymenae]